jgi:ABC-type glycerol-3-phosphate transport system substrate-binding protein
MKAIAAAFAAVVLLLALAGCGGDEEASPPTTTGTTETTTTETTATETTTTETATDEQPPGPTTVRVVVTGGVPKGGIVRQSVDKGNRVVLLVTSDVADEIHLHGYDLSTDVAAGGTARLPFKATIPGRFEVELEQRGVPIAELTVNP